MKFTSSHYIIAAAAVLLVAVVSGTQLWSDRKIASLEREVQEFRALAAERQNAATELEHRSAVYKARNEYLEKQVAEIKAIATKQDAQLEKLSANTAIARGNVDRARGIRSAAATAGELCRKLEALGHPCR